MIQPIGSLIQRSRPAKGGSERGGLFEQILSRLNPDRAKKGLKPITYARLGYLLTDVPTPDLYALISRCNDAERRGFPWSAIFWKEISPKAK